MQDNDLTTPNGISGFDRLIAALSQRDAWVPFLAHVKATRDKACAGEVALSNRLMDWAESYLGPDYADILAEGYVRFVSNVNMEQMRYEVRGSYKNRSFAEVFETTYDSESFMKSYHWGVYVSTFAWEHHLKIYRYFVERFLPMAARLTDVLRLLDLGCGSGLWSMLALTDLTTANVDSVDISKTSVRETKAMKDRLGFDERMSVHLGDALTWVPPQDGQEATFNAGICCFVLEHLEQPQELLNNLALRIKPRGLAFVTTALTAAESDHIYEFKRESEVIQLAEQANFRVMETMSLAPESYREDGRFLPRSMAMILSRRQGEVW